MREGKRRCEMHKADGKNSHDPPSSPSWKRVRCKVTVNHVRKSYPPPYKLGKLLCDNKDSDAMSHGRTKYLLE